MDREAALAALTAPGEPYELEEVELYGRTCRAFRRAPPTLRDLFDQGRSDLPFIVYADERLSSRAAEDRFVEMRASGRARRKDAKQLDAMAAQIILENWLQSLHEQYPGFSTDQPA